MVFGLTFPLANNVGDETNNVGEEIVLLRAVHRNPELVFSS